MAIAHNIEVVLKDIYPLIAKQIPSHQSKLKNVYSKFMEARHKYLYDTAPCDRIPYSQEDADEFFKAINVSEKEIDKKMQKLYYINEAKFNPRCAKSALVIAILCVIRYYFKKKDIKMARLSIIYLSFSGQFYPSIHYSSFPTVVPSENRYVMDYVVNEMLTNKYDLKTEKSVLGAVVSRGMTWYETYKDRLEQFDDEDVVYLIQQLRDRLKAFMQNIAELYYKAYNNKDVYMVYDSDNLDEDNYRLADNDTMKIERAVEATMTNINTHSVDWTLCKASSDSNVRVDELRNIIESILDGNSNMLLVKELVTLIISTYFRDSKDKDVRNTSFIVKSITPKPNSKDKYVLRQREIVETLLSDNSTAYNRRKKREATRSSYHKSIVKYFTLLINKSNM